MAEYDDARVARRRQDRTDLAFSRIIPKPGPKMASAVIWWAFGLYVLFFARAPYQPTPEEEARYSELMQRVVFSEEAREAQAELAFAQEKLDEVNVFFWRWRSPYDRLVPPRQKKFEIARDRFSEAMRAREEAQSQAKATVGIWSQYGLDEARDRFWQAYQSGKDFAKRMTFWDVVFGVGGRSRDEEWFAVLLKWIGQIIMNFSIGLISALFSFGFTLVSMIWEYKVGYISGLLFFLVAMSGASAMVATFIGGMASVAVGGVYAVAKSASNNQRLRDREGRRPRYVQHQHQRPQYAHYD